MRPGLPPGSLLPTATLVAFSLLVGLVSAVFGVMSGPDPALGDMRAARSSGAPSGAAAIADSRTVPACAPAPLRVRAGQVLVVGMPDVTSAASPLARALTRLRVGGVFVADANVVDAEQVRSLIGGLQRRSRVPLLVATDEEAGRVSSFRPLLGPTSSARALAAIGPPRQVRAFAADLGRALRDFGINVDLAPVADLDAGAAGGVIGDRSFSDEPAVAAAYARAFARGLADGGVLPVAKHFPGHGRAETNVHSETAVVDAGLDQLRDNDLRPFRALISDGVPLVMMSHVTYSAMDADRPASLSPAAYRLLRGLGFSGVAMTDSLGMGAIHRRWDFPEAAVRAVAAGADAVLATDGRQAAAMRDALVRAVRQGRLDEARLNEAAGRMLALKAADAKAMTCASPPPRPALLTPALVTSVRNGWQG